ncbi:MAG: hypothetical protein IAF38_07875 [Bacteroidia bacterium]|nr:hypothetical protein [Bacteroidia bacterium]
MAIESRDTLKTYFETGDVPTQQQFYNFIESAFSMLDDGIFKYEPVAGTKRFGIGVNQPAYPLGIKAQENTENYISFHDESVDNVHLWSINRNPGANAFVGFNIAQVTLLGSLSRMFISEETGYVGLGTTQPKEKLHLEESTTAGITGIKVLNTATSNSQGWKVGHLEEAATPERDGAFSFIEIGPVTEDERMIIRTDGNVGINESIPDTKLHVSRPIGESGAALDLIEGTGIFVVGPIDTKNIVQDYRGIQARQGNYIGDVLNITVDELNLQRMGGNILIHGDSTIALTQKAIITTDAKLGLGTITPAERIDIDGAIKIGTTVTSNEGTIRFTGSAFEGRVGGSWLPFTGTGPWLAGTGEGIYYDAATAPRVGIGTNATPATLTVFDQETAVVNSSVGAFVKNAATNTGGGANDHRVSVLVEGSGTWGGDAFSKNIGIYARIISGANAVNRDLAAVLNGNVLVGDLVAGSVDVIGTLGEKILAIQSGVAPTASPVDTVQLYSADVTVGPDTYATLHLRTENGDAIKLYKASAIEAVNNMDPIPDTYDTTVAQTIENMRLRINDLEARLVAFELLTAS